MSVFPSFFTKLRFVFETEPAAEFFSELLAFEGAFETYLKPYMQIAYKKKIYYNGKNQTLYVLMDGSAFSYRHFDTRDITFFPKDAEKCIKRGYYENRK